MFYKLIKIMFCALIVSIVSLLSSCGGGGSTTSSSIVSSSSDYAGVAQKGPLRSGSLIIASLVDNKGEITGNSRKATMRDSRGAYSLSLPDNWGQDSPIQLSATGLFLSESDGKSSKNKATLTSITNNKNTLSINLLTDLAAKRTTYLLNKGKPFAKAQKQAEKELANIFGILNIHELDISQRSRFFSDNAQLLLLSGAMMDVADKKEINPQVIIDDIASDFSENGQLNEEGDDWFIKIQAQIRANPAVATDHYASVFDSDKNIDAPTGKLLPKNIPLASRPVASVPTEIFAKPGETIVLDGSASHDSGNIINFTWFRVDQQQYTTPFSDRFSDSPSITVPNEESVLLYALVVTDEDKLTHTALVKVIVKEPPRKNKPPEADDQNLKTNEDTPLSITLTGTDPDNDQLDFNINTPALLSHGLLEGTAPNLTYVPDHDFHGTDSFIFTVSDGNASSQIATVTITVSPINDRPTAFDLSFSVKEGGTLPIELIGLDPDGDAITFSHTAVSHGALTGNGKNLIYKPESTYQGSDSFTYQVSDGSVNSISATVSIEVNPVNHPPVATPQVDNNKVTTKEDTAVNITVAGTDPDPGDTTTLEFLLESSVSHGTLTGTLPSLLYTPANNYNDSDSFTFRVKDKGGKISAPAEVQIEIKAENDPPVAVPQVGAGKVVLNENDSVTSITLVGTDVDDSVSSLVFSIITSPSHGSVTGTAPNIVYTPQANYNGADSLTFRVTDPGGKFSDAVVEINVKPVNSAPVATADSYSINEDTAKEITLAGSDVDGDTLAFSIVSGTGPSHGILDVTKITNTPASVTYTPASNYNGPDVFEFKVTDPGGKTSDAKILLDVKPVNDPPVAINYTCTLPKPASSNGVDVFRIDASAFNFTDPDGGNVTVQLFSIAEALNTSPFTYDSSAFPSVGTLIATPQTIPPPDVVDTFKYKITDSNGDSSNTAEVRVIYK